MNRLRTREGDQVFWSVWGEGSCPSIKAYEGVQASQLVPSRAWVLSQCYLLPSGGRRDCLEHISRPPSEKML